MGFSKVYKSLQDIFPEIDNRVLRAVALENRKDADAAADVVLTKVIPHFIARSTHSSSSSHGKDVVQSPKVFESCPDVFHGEENPLVENATCVNEEDHGQSLDVESEFDQSLDDVTGGKHRLFGDDRMDGDELENSDKICEQLLETSGALKPCLEKEYNDSKDTACKAESSLSSIIEDESTLNLGSNRSSEICCTAVIEDSISVEKNKKKTLFEKMQSVVSLMKALEVEESAAEQVKKEAANGGSEILKRLEEINEKLQRTKEANDMHSGEVYGEKAILATEVKELQSRILSLSEQRDTSLRILDEMCQRLEGRLDAVKKEKEAAEKSILEKEDLARNALAEKSLILEKVVQEANVLKQLEEENSKLREFLVDRGRVVDILQGEICLINEDVKLLKEKFDELLPHHSKRRRSFNHSILDATSSSSSSQVIVHADPLSETAVDTYLLLPSSPLSETTLDDEFLSSLLGEGHPSSETAVDDEFLSSLLVEPSPSPLLSVAEPRHDDNKDIDDDGWEICDI